MPTLVEMQERRLNLNAMVAELEQGRPGATCRRLDADCSATGASAYRECLVREALALIVVRA